MVGAGVGSIQSDSKMLVTTPSRVSVSKCSLYGWTGMSAVSNSSCRYGADDALKDTSVTGVPEIRVPSLPS